MHSDLYDDDYDDGSDGDYDSVLREWILENREVKSEMKICFTHFEK